MCCLTGSPPPRLGSFGGKDVADTTHRIVHTAIENNVAVQMNFARTGGKLGSKTWRCCAWSLVRVTVFLILAFFSTVWQPVFYQYELLYTIILTSMFLFSLDSVGKKCIIVMQLCWYFSNVVFRSLRASVRYISFARGNRSSGIVRWCH